LSFVNLEELGLKTGCGVGVNLRKRFDSPLGRVLLLLLMKGVHQLLRIWKKGAGLYSKGFDNSRSKGEGCCFAHEYSVTIVQLRLDIDGLKWLNLKIENKNA